MASRFKVKLSEDQMEMTWGGVIYRFEYGEAGFSDCGKCDFAKQCEENNYIGDTVKCVRGSRKDNKTGFWLYHGVCIENPESIAKVNVDNRDEYDIMVAQMLLG